MNNKKTRYIKLIANILYFSNWIICILELIKVHLQYGKNAYMVVNTLTSVSATITLNMADTITYTYTGRDCASHPESGTLTLTSLGAGESVLVVVD